MSLNPEQLRQHCETIISSRRILNKIVVLCEGKGGVWDKNSRLSPQSYKNMERMPDANFYKACVPQSWSQYTPQFFNCGDRKDVLDTYFTLLGLHQEDSTNSYLNPDKLFAIVDLDLQIQNISPTYPYNFSDTEAIFCHLYHKAIVNEENASQHRIWVTGLIHKEAYFFLPQIQPIYDEFSAIFNENTFVIKNIYNMMADALVSDSDLKIHFPKVSNRVSHCSELDCTGVEELKTSWKEQFQNATDDRRQHELILALLTIKKAKEYWNQIQAPDDWTGSPDTFKDQILLAIGRFYSQQGDESKYHLPCFFKTLRQFI